MSPALQAAYAIAQGELEKFDHDSLWKYEKPTMEALKPFLPEDRVERRAFMVELQKEARGLDVNRTKWTGFTVVANLLDSFIAYLTPGFVEARKWME